MKYLLQIVVALIFLVLGRFIFPEELGVHFTAEGIMLIITLIVVDLGYELYKNWNYIGLLFQTKVLLRKQDN